MPVNQHSWLEHGPGLKMYFLLKMVISMVVFRCVYNEICEDVLNKSRNDEPVSDLIIESLQYDFEPRM